MGFDVTKDGTREMILNHRGLGIGIADPQEALHVSGNMITTGQAVIGGAIGSDNLSVHGTFAINHIKASDNITLDQSTIYAADSSAGDLTLTLPDASSVLGRLVTIKKVSPDHRVIIRGTGSDLIDGKSTITLTKNNVGWPSAMFQSSGSAWNALSLRGVERKLIFDDFNSDFIFFDTSNKGIVIKNGIGIGASDGIYFNIGVTIARGNQKVSIAGNTSFSIMSKFYGVSQVSKFGAGIGVGWSSIDGEFNAYGGGSNADTSMVGICCTDPTSNEFGIYHAPEMSNMHLETQLSNSRTILNIDSWYRYYGTVVFDGSDQYHWIIQLDEYDSTGINLISENVLSADVTISANIGTEARFLFVGRRDRGFNTFDKIELTNP